MKVLNVRKTEGLKLCESWATASNPTQFSMFVEIGFRWGKFLLFEQHDDAWKKHNKLCIKSNNDSFPVIKLFIASLNVWRKLTPFFCKLFCSVFCQYWYPRCRYLRRHRNISWVNKFSHWYLPLTASSLKRVGRTEWWAVGQIEQDMFCWSPTIVFVQFGPTLQGEIVVKDSYSSVKNKTVIYYLLNQTILHCVQYYLISVLLLMQDNNFFADKLSNAITPTNGIRYIRMIIFNNT